MLSLKFRLPSWLDVIVLDEYGFSVLVKSFSRLSPESLFKELSSATFCLHLKHVCKNGATTIFAHNFKSTIFSFSKGASEKNQALSFEKTGEKQNLTQFISLKKRQKKENASFSMYIF